MTLTSKRKLKAIAAGVFFPACYYYAKSKLDTKESCRNFVHTKIVASFSAKNGITHGAALQHAAMRRHGFDAETLDAGPEPLNPFRRIRHEPGTAYILHSGGPQIPNLLLSVLPAASAAYRIAYLAWELPSPPAWPDLTPLVNEIWTTSDYSRTGLLKAGYKIPVRVVPHNVPMQAPRIRTDGPFTVLAMADARSGLMRKNPGGAVDAFCQAFGNDKNAKLIIKLNGKGPASGALDAKTIEKIHGHKNIMVLDQFMSEAELDKLFRSADAFLSLHRAEGFGLPMLEAMCRGIPVVATAWSGNMQFMDDDVAALVPFKLTGTKGDVVYERYENSVWAEPDIEVAAQLLHRLATDNEYYDNFALKGRQRAETLDKEWCLPV